MYHMHTLAASKCMHEVYSVGFWLVLVLGGSTLCMFWRAMDSNVSYIYSTCLLSKKAAPSETGHQPPLIRALQWGAPRPKIFLPSLPRFPQHKTSDVLTLGDLVHLMAHDVLRSQICSDCRRSFYEIKINLIFTPLTKASGANHFEEEEEGRPSMATLVFFFHLGWGGVRNFHHQEQMDKFSC